MFRKYLRVGKVGSTTWSATSLAKISQKTRGRCYLCGAVLGGRAAIAVFRFSVDHLVPLAAGGRNGRGNVVPMCQHCNGLKGCRTIKQMQLVPVRRRFREDKLQKLHRLMQEPNQDIIRLEGMFDEWKQNHVGFYWFEQFPHEVNIPKDLSRFTVLLRDVKFSWRRAVRRLVRRVKHLGLVNREDNSSLPGRTCQLSSKTSSLRSPRRRNRRDKLQSNL